MQVKFKSPEANMKFAKISNSNNAIAVYMKDGTHEAVNYDNGNIALVNDKGNDIILNNDGSISKDGNGWVAYIFMEERKYFIIDGE